MTQTLIVHVIRTAKVPFFQSWASLPMLLITATVMGVGIYLPSYPLSYSKQIIPISVLGKFMVLITSAFNLLQNGV